MIDWRMCWIVYYCFRKLQKSPRLRMLMMQSSFWRSNSGSTGQTSTSTTTPERSSRYKQPCTVAHLMNRILQYHRIATVKVMRWNSCHSFFLYCDGLQLQFNICWNSKELHRITFSSPHSLEYPPEQKWCCQYIIRPVTCCYTRICGKAWFRIWLRGG